MDAVHWGEGGDGGRGWEGQTPTTTIQGKCPEIIINNTEFGCHHSKYPDPIHARMLERVYINTYHVCYRCCCCSVHQTTLKLNIHLYIAFVNAFSLLILNIICMWIVERATYGLSGLIASSSFFPHFFFVLFGFSRCFPFFYM